MKTEFLITFRIIAFALCASAPCALAQSAVPNSMSYQGRISDANGNLIGSPTPVNRTVIFRVWDSASATAPANLLYSEQQVVTIASGEFNVLVGQGAQVGTEPKPAFDSVFSGAQRFLGVTVDDGTAAADPEISPRQQLVSSAFAFRARTAEEVPANAITSSMLAAGAVTPNSIAANAVDSTKLATGAALTNIAANSIDSSKLAAASVTTAKIAASAIDSSKLATGAVTTASIAAGAIDSSKLAAGAVTTAAIAANAIDSTLLAAGAVTTAAIANNAINTAKIADGSVFEADLSNGSVTAAKLGPGIGVWNEGSGYVYRQSGRVVIGSNLDVTGGFGFGVLNSGAYFAGVVQSAGYTTHSDARVKRIIGRSSPSSDLELIRKLQVTDYRMIDKTTLGDGVQKGFIAQEVQKIMPEAVTKTQKHPIPSINAPATKTTFDPGTKTLRVVLNKAHGLKKGDTVQLKDDKRFWHLNVSESIDATTFVAGPVEAPMPEVFVYGKLVDDMLSVDYNRLFTTGIGAIQDLASQLDTIKAENAELRAKLAATERRFAELEAADKARDARLAAIEKALRTSGGDVVPAATARKISVK